MKPTQQTDKATTRPWKSVVVKSNISIKWHDGMVTVANIGWMLRQNYPEATEANAALIVKAVNEHAALVAVADIVAGFSYMPDSPLGKAIDTLAAVRGGKAVQS